MNTNPPKGYVRAVGSITDGYLRINYRKDMYAIQMWPTTVYFRKYRPTDISNIGGHDENGTAL